MRRREFITLLGGATAWPLDAYAQQRGKIPRAGVLWHAGSAEEETIYLNALVQGLNGLGYFDGRTIYARTAFPE
jgi:putative ABC transport system substrate-binding protein